MKLKSRKGNDYMSKKVDLAKYRRLAKYMQIVMKVFYTVSIVCIIIAVAGGVFLTLMPETTIGAISNSGGSLSFSIDNVIMFNVDHKNAAADSLKSVYSSICFMAVIIGVLLAITFKQLQLILGTVKIDKPFTQENSRRLTIIGAALMIGAFVKRIGEVMVAHAIINTLKINELSVNYSADSSFIIMGFIVLILAGVFKYGSYLQNEYDSTV